MINERLMAQGSWSVPLKDTTPASLIIPSRLGYQVYVTPTELPASMQTTPTLNSVARYQGVLLRQNSREIGGAGLLWYLGDTNKSAVLNPSGWADITFDFADWIENIMAFGGVTIFGVAAAPYTEGTVYDFDATTFELRIGGQLRRPMLDKICNVYNAMYQVRADNTFHAGRQEDLFVSATPEVIALPKGGVRDIDLAGLKALELDRGWDVSDLQTGWYVLGAGEGNTAVFDHQPTAISPLKDPLGNAVHLPKLINAPDAVSTAEAAAVGNGEFWEALYSTGSTTLSTETHDIGRLLTPGDVIYVYDPLRGFFDTTNQQTYAGQTMFPAERLVQAVTWPLERGMGVYMRDGDSPNAITDLTQYVEWEAKAEPVVRFELGGFRRRLVPVAENPAVERRLR